MRYDTITAIGEFEDLNASAATDYLRLDPGTCSGGDDAPLRTVTRPRPGLDGVMVFPPLDDAQIITLSGPAIIESAETEEEYLDAVETLFQALKSALDAMKTAPDDLAHADGSLSVWKHSPAEKSWDRTVCRFTFSVVVDVT